MNTPKPANSLPAPKAKASEISVTEEKASEFKKMHTLVIGWHIYSQQLGQGVAENAQDTAFSHVADTMLRMKPRDPIEEMLVIQSLWTHARIARLSTVVNNQTGLNCIKVVNTACDNAANTFRRQMLALAEYRRPPRTDSFVAIKQANVAQQQVVQNAENQNPKIDARSNEKGLPPDSTAALPAVAGGPAIPSPIHSAIQAVVEDAGPANGGGQGNRQNERDEARRPHRGSPGGKA